LNKLPTELWVAIVGLAGAFVGTVIQAVIANASTKASRRTVFEAAVAERRMDVYAQIIQHVARMEAIFGRNIGPYADRLGKDLQATPEPLKLSAGSQFEAKLITFCSWVVAAQFAHYKVLYGEHMNAYLLLQQAISLREIPQIEQPTEVDIEDLNKLVAVTGRRVERVVGLMRAAIQSEIEGKEPSYAGKGFRARLRRRREFAEIERIEIYVEREVGRFSHRLEILGRQLD
jgi:hypothetical protein